METFILNKCTEILLSAPGETKMNQRSQEWYISRLMLMQVQFPYIEFLWIAGLKSWKPRLGMLFIVVSDLACRNAIIPICEAEHNTS